VLLIYLRVKYLKKHTILIKLFKMRANSYSVLCTSCYH